MSTSYKCPYCNIRYFSNRNSYSQHVNRCINLYDISTEESNTEVSEVTDMLLDNDDFNRIEERQSVQEIENLPSGSEITDLFEYGDYDADASVSLEVISNIPERFEEILFESSRNEDSDVENLQNEDSNIERLQNEDLDVRSESSRNEDSDVEEFPNESYADLMTLVTKYNLNNKAGNAIIKFFNKHSNLSISPLPKNIETGRKYMDKMNLSRLLYYKHRILVHNNKEYFINYQPVIKCIENLLSNPEIFQLFVYDYKKLEIENEQSYGEQYTGNWWKKAKESIPSVAYILSIILYSDATTTDTLGKGSLHPIYISLGNIPTWRRNKEDTKQLLGYLPILSAKDEREKKSSEFKKLVRETFHNSIKFLLDPLFTNDDDDGDGIELKIDNEIFWFFPRVSTIICDWPEACTFSLTYKSTNSNYPCHFCLVSKENLNNTRLRDDQMVLRNKENMLQYYNNGTTEKASLEPVFNYFWNIPNINVYVATVPDRMHHLDLGLYRYQIEFTKKLLFEAEGRSLVDKMNRRITLIPRHSELKIFSGGLQSIALLTADNYRNIMKVMVFVVDDLLNKDLSEVYVKWNEMYLLSRQETFKESDLKNFQEAIEKWANLFIKLFGQFSNSDFKLPKLHSWVHHIVDTIREFGAINGYTTETYEALHKTYVKIPYRLSNKKDVEEQMMKTIRRKAIIKQNDFKKKFKTPLKFNYSSKLFEFDISEAFEFIDKYKNETNLDEKMIKGLDHFIQSLDSYFDLLKISTAQGCHIKIYRSVTLENRAILRTTNMFHKRPWFSNISVTMNDEELFEYQSDNGICYAQTLLITEVFLKKEKSLHLALVQWYDFISKRTPFVYGCPLLELTEVYNFIEIEAIEDIVHIVPRFDKTNEYLVNKYLF
ncbi:hypothetical protein Glove_421g100 [Diversispora epigaea]|uniref:Zn-finger domain-containing protein n=3 Tax=Diversispora epigaea TaxID=1348612 RepID=A0A397GV53_9GLOM|nr:hypothetical protein Glove_421g100 [Diversispora epigaea]